MDGLRMSEYKIAGHCSQCDKPCFEVMQVYEAHERLPGEPKKLGPPRADALRITFMLMDGTKMSLTFCASCAKSLSPPHYTAIWRKVLRSWARELSEKPVGERMPAWYRPQFASGLLCELGRKKWTEVING